jgi:hypothetical protein
MNTGFFIQELGYATDNIRYPEMLPGQFFKHQEISFFTGSFISEIYTLNNKKFKWRYYYYGLEDRMVLPQFSASFCLYSDKVDL